MSACSLAAALSVSALNPMSAAVLDAKPIAQPAPSYPSELRTACLEGQVVVSFTITAQGDVINAQVVSSTDRRLEAPALEAIQKWKFAPAMRDGVAIKVKALQPIAFAMPDLHANTATRFIVSNSKPASQAKNSTSVN
jgi:protein TonB